MMMTQRISPSNKRRRVSFVRDFPQFSVKDESDIGGDDVATIKENLDGKEDRNCVGVAYRDHHRPKEESFDSIMKKAGFNVANGNLGNGKFPPSKRNVPLPCEGKVQPLSVEEGIKLMAYESQRRRCFGKPLVSTKVVQKHRYSPAKKKLSNATALRVRHSPMKKLSNASRLRANAHRPTQHKDERRSGVLSVIQRNRLSKDLTPRQKVQEVLRIFTLVFDELDRNKAARRGGSETAKSRIDYQTWTILREMGMQVNSQKRIGSVPGIKVGDKIQFKAALSVIGLHFGIMSGIDYMYKGNKEVATSIVSSEGNDYGDRFINDMMIYCGQGGNMRSKDHKAIKDQKLVGGNLALANSIKEKTPVRVIRGERRLDNRGKDYVYDGLYRVEKYWEERGPQGNILFKFKLRRTCQPYVDF
ncbi:unnamed protein product [Arabidopsis thaliana]|uniref:YDG domain-containing protein n=1 Tax=Arabidopsis thaliana TaxID=3702 RepID=A0A654G8T3_ARATH|nr:unnamed protein product [Arabidopsis thaliana]